MNEETYVYRRIHNVGVSHAGEILQMAYRGKGKRKNGQESKLYTRGGKKDGRKVHRMVKLCKTESAQNPAQTRNPMGYPFGFPSMLIDHIL